MKKATQILIIALISFSCSSQRTDIDKKQVSVGIAQKTPNPNIPYIYKNGYSNFSITKIPVVQKNDTLYLNELKFNAVFSAMYLKKVMYDRFGKWTKEIRSNNENHPILLWENVKLFESEEELFTVFANGDEDWNEIYASVLVFDNEKNDCLREDNRYKKSIIEYFTNGIKNLNNNKKFYDVYWKSVNKYEKVNIKK